MEKTGEWYEQQAAQFVKAQRGTKMAGWIFLVLAGILFVSLLIGRKKGGKKRMHQFLLFAAAGVLAAAWPQGGVIGAEKTNTEIKLECILPYGETDVYVDSLEESAPQTEYQAGAVQQTAVEGTTSGDPEILLEERENKIRVMLTGVKETGEYTFHILTMKEQDGALIADKEYRVIVRKTLRIRRGTLAENERVYDGTRRLVGFKAELSGADTKHIGKVMLKDAAAGLSGADAGVQEACMDNGELSGDAADSYRLEYLYENGEPVVFQTRISPRPIFLKVEAGEKVWNQETFENGREPIIKEYIPENESEDCGFLNEETPETLEGFSWPKIDPKTVGPFDQVGTYEQVLYAAEGTGNATGNYRFIWDREKQLAGTLTVLPEKAEPWQLMFAESENISWGVQDHTIWYRKENGQLPEFNWQIRTERYEEVIQEFITKDGTDFLSVRLRKTGDDTRSTAPVLFELREILDPPDLELICGGEDICLMVSKGDSEQLHAFGSPQQLTIQESRNSLTVPVQKVSWKLVREGTKEAVLIGEEVTRPDETGKAVLRGEIPAGKTEDGRLNPGNYYLIIEAWDIAGGSHTLLSEQILFDYDAPLLRLEQNGISIGKADGLLYRKENCRITAKLSETGEGQSGITSAKWTLQHENGEVETGEAETGEAAIGEETIGKTGKRYPLSAEMQIPLKITGQEECVWLQIEAWDLAENKTEKEVRIVLDNCAPRISIKRITDTKLSDGCSTSGCVRVTGQIAERFWEPDHAITVSINGRRIEAEKLLRMDRKELLAEYGIRETGLTGTETVSLFLSFEAEGSYRVSFEAEDLSGNQCCSEDVFFLIDRTAPSADLSIHTPDSGKRENLIFGAADEILYSFQTSENGMSGIRRIWLEIRNVDTGKKEERPVLSASAEDRSTGKFGTLMAGWEQRTEGRYQAQLFTEDWAGNQSRSQTVSYTVDVRKPEVRIQILEPENQDMQSVYYAHTAEAELIVQDAYFDTASRPLVNGMAADFSGWKKMEDGNWYGRIRLTADGTYDICFEAADLAGNRSDPVNKQLVIDTKGPEIAGFFEQEKLISGAYLSTGSRLSIVLRDANPDPSGTEFRIILFRNGTAKQIRGIRRIKTEGEEAWTCDLYEEGWYSLCVSGRDLAGNRTEQSEPMYFLIDRTAPEVILTGAASGTDATGCSVPAVLIRDPHLDPESVQAKLTGTINGKQEGEQMVLIMREKGEVRIRFPHYSEMPDDQYLLTVTGQDLAGNKVRIVRSFIRNQNGAVFYMGEALQKLISERYVKEVPDLELIEETIQELSDCGLLLSRSGEPLRTERGVNWDTEKHLTADGKIQYRYRIGRALFEKEGYYELVFFSEDTSHNRKNTQKEPAVFVVDRSAPVLNVWELENGAVYEGKTHEIRIHVRDQYSPVRLRCFKDGSVIAEFSAEEIRKKEGMLSVSLNEGVQQILLEAEDAAGNKSILGPCSITVSSENKTEKTTDERTGRAGQIGIFMLVIAGCVLLLRRLIQIRKSDIMQKTK